MSPPATLDSFIHRLPKVELHVHLEGSIEGRTLRELARTKRRHEQEVEDWIAERNRTGFRYPSFRKFLEAFTFVTQLLESPEDYALAATRMVEGLAAENVKYAEVTLSAGVVLWKKQSLEAVFDAAADAAAEAEARLGLRVQWVLDAIRHFGTEHAREVLHRAARLRPRGVVAFGIGGDEARGPAELFPEVYREARDLGLHVTAHAGETVGPESVRAAVELLGAERIGHGLTAARDPAVMDLLRERQVPLEVCLSSNVSTGVLARLEDHPLGEFLRAGLVVTLNSDDPAIFGTSLEREMKLAATRFALSEKEIVRLAENAIRAVFLPEGEKAALLRNLSSAAGR